MPPLSLDDLIAPVDRQTFFEEIWDKKHLHAQGARDRFDEILTLEDLDSLMLAGRGSSRQVLNIVPPPGSDRSQQTASFRDTEMSRLYQATKDGDTLVVNGAHRFWAPLATALSGLDPEFGHEITCNLYFTPAGSQGFPFHCDGHDVIVLQIYGAKQWSIYDPVYRRPMSKLKYGPWLGAHSVTRIKEEDANLLEEVVVRAGDFLYVPRGFYHKVVSLEEAPSLHLTLGIHPWFFTDLLKVAVEVAAERSEFLRGCLPLPGAGAPGPDQMAELFSTAIKELQEHTDFERAHQILENEGALGTTMVPSGHFKHVMRQGEIDLETKMSRRKGMTVKVPKTDNGGPAMMLFGGKRFTGPRPILPALEFMCEHETWKVADLPLPEKMADSSKVVLARRLLREGFLTLAEEPA